jgi:hypothetical protein
MCTDVLVDLSTGDSVLVADVALLLGSATANCCAHSGGRKFAPMQTTDRVYAALVILAPGSTTVYCQWSHVIRPTANRQGPQAPLTCGVDWCVCDWYSMCTSGNDIVIGQETPDCTATLSPPPPISPAVLLLLLQQRCTSVAFSQLGTCRGFNKWFLGA